MDSSKVTAAPSSLQLGEKSFKAYPLRDIDFSELDEYVRIKYIRLARAAMEDEDIVVLMPAVIRAASFIKWFNEEGRSFMSSAEGTARLAWQMTNRGHKMRFDQFIPLVDYKRDAEEINDLFYSMNFEDLDGVSEDDGDANSDSGN